MEHPAGVSGCSRPESFAKCPAEPIRACYRNLPIDECEPIPLTLPVAIKILKIWYRDASYEADDALYDMKCIWHSDDEVSRKLVATNRLLIYYLLILAIYIIQICFIIDEKLFEGFCRILSSLKNSYSNSPQSLRNDPPVRRETL